ncbi:MAG: hypothetical protein EA361_12990 [Bacteroidetes bacterium]|nr:MAG: hypothetical protein EA361_12990 [Bacteroidota bacterium]
MIMQSRTWLHFPMSKSGNILDEKVEIKYQAVKPVWFEESFKGLYQVERIEHQWPFEAVSLNHY